MINCWLLLNFIIIIIKCVFFICSVIVLLRLIISKTFLDTIINASVNELLKCSDDELVEKIYDLDNNEKKVLYDSRNKVSELNVISFVSVISFVVNQYLIYELGPLKQYYINKIALFIFKAVYYRPFFLTEGEIGHWRDSCNRGINNFCTYEFLVGIIIVTLVFSLFMSINKYNKFIEKLKLVILMSEEKSINLKNKAKIKLNTTMLGK